MTPIPEFLSDERSLGVFLLVSVVMGGGAAWLAGRAIAADLAAVVACGALHADPRARRALHPFRAVRRSSCRPHYYLVDTAVCLGFGLIGFRLMRVRQMVTRYGWLNDRAGLFGWRRISGCGLPGKRVTFPAFAA